MKFQCGFKGLKTYRLKFKLNNQSSMKTSSQEFNLFKFQRFSIDDSSCAMKVGTDGILLGAWANVDGAHRVLDVGSGSGLIALLIAQRTESCRSEIVAVEVDEMAAHQATANVAESNWKDRIEVVCKSFQKYAAEQVAASTNHMSKFDLIICNPPFFANGIRSPNEQRKTARHCDQLCIEDLLMRSAQLLSPTGSLSMIVPYDNASETIESGSQFALKPIRQTNVRPLPKSKLHRALIEFGIGFERAPIVKEMTIESSHHVYSDEFRMLTKEFYLRFANQT